GEPGRCTGCIPRHLFRRGPCPQRSGVEFFPGRTAVGEPLGHLDGPPAAFVGEKVPDAADAGAGEQPADARRQPIQVGPANPVQGPVLSRMSRTALLGGRRAIQCSLLAASGPYNRFEVTMPPLRPLRIVVAAWLPEGRFERLRTDCAGHDWLDGREP